MTPQYAFSFDARFCSGCKACQAACKDKNNLPTGVLWRRVIEVSGGSWQQNNEAWQSTVFAYNLSLACNHCMHPKCAGVCPTRAYEVREDGIVFLDTNKCMGCGYCAWACPYEVPQYNAETGTMTKCNFCLDNLQQGLSPACVAACPMRVLDYSEMDDVQGQALWETPARTHPYPLPTFSHSQPRLAIVPHPAMLTDQDKSVANLEEIQPRMPSTWQELPLILFTLLTQMAVGGLWVMNYVFSPLWLLVHYQATWLRLLPSVLIGASLGIGMLASFAHLGAKRNAWRALSHWRKSSLSREILFVILFGLGWLCTALEIVIWHRSTFELWAMTATLGIGLIYNMSQVYRIPAAQGWNTWRTNVSFFVSALLLGITLMATLLAYESSRTSIQVSSLHWTMIGGISLFLLFAQLSMSKRFFQDSLYLLRIGLILLCVALIAIALLEATLQTSFMSILIFASVASEEAIGRWLFYRYRTQPLQ